MFDYLKKFLIEEDGSYFLEYGLVIAMALGLVFGLKKMSGSIGSVMQNAGESIGTLSSDPSGSGGTGGTD